MDEALNHSYMQRSLSGQLMRLLIYLLALISGFSAAEAARAEVSPASSVAQTAVVAAEVLASESQQAGRIPANFWPNARTALAPSEAQQAVIAPNPVSRHDRTRE